MPSAESAEPRQYAKGAITRIQMHNFLVYRDVTVPVGPRLNLVLGPNGTGKSSIVCALALALGAPPKILGRADNLADFVMHEEENAWVEVELYVPGGKFIVRREFKRKNKSASAYSLNGRNISEKDIKQRVLGMGVQVENLCTFLPQDRVGDFSGYNPKQILAETCKAVDEQALYAKHQELIDADKSCVGREGQEQKVAEQLKQARATNEGLQRDVARMEQRAKLLERMHLIKQRKAWILFNEARNETIAAAERKTAKEKELADAAGVDEPLQAKVDNLLVDVQRTKSEMDSAKRKYVKLEDSCKQIKAETKKLADRKLHIIAELASEAGRRTAKETKLAALKQKTKALQREADKTATECGAAADIQAQIQSLEAEREEHDAREAQLYNSGRAASNAVRNADRDLAAAKADRAAMQDNSRFKKSRQGPEILRIRAWIQANRGLFREDVYGPMVTEITVNDEDATRIVDDHVKNTLLTGFVVQCSADRMRLSDYIKSLPNKPSLVVYTCEPNSDKGTPRPFTAQGMEALKRDHGAIGYLDSLVDGPGPVMQMLRDHAGVHTVILGSGDTEAQLSSNPQLLDKLARGQSGNGRSGAVFTIRPAGRGSKPFIQSYNARVSNYTNNLTSTVREVKQEPQYVGGGIDPEAIASADARIQQCTAALEQAQQVHQGLQGEVHAVKEQKKRCDADIQKLRQQEVCKQLAANRLQTHLNKIADVQDELDKWGTTARDGYVAKLTNCINRMATEVKKLLAKTRECTAALPGLALTRLAHDQAKSIEAAHKEKLAEAKRKREKLMKEVADLAAAFTDIKKAAKVLKAKAEAIAVIKEADGKTDNELGLKLKELPSSIEMLDEDFNSCQTKVSNTADNPEVVARHAAGLKQIAELEKELAALTEGIEAEAHRLSSIREPWLNKLQQMVSKLNAKFSVYMEQMNCGGEVCLARAEKYADWGIEIKVRFRNKDAAGGDGMAKVLDANVHSGGERSVSTILYLMAMQDLQRSPFRVVDEINQGMDPHNERLVFSRIVRNSCGPDRPQFFLITPKLLQGLVAMDNRDVTVLFIMNGLYAPPGTEPFTLKELNDRKRALLSGSSSSSGGGSSGGGSNKRARTG